MACDLASLALVGEDIRNDAVLLSKTVERVVGLALLADESTENVGERIVGNNVTLSIELGYVDLSRSVVLGLD